MIRTGVLEFDFSRLVYDITLIYMWCATCGMLTACDMYM